MSVLESGCLSLFSFAVNIGLILIYLNDPFEFGALRVQVRCKIEQIIANNSQ